MNGSDKMQLKKRKKRKANNQKKFGLLYVLRVQIDAL